MLTRTLLIALSLIIACAGLVPSAASAAPPIVM